MRQINLNQNKIVILDDEDFERFSPFHWFHRAERDNKQGYAIRHEKVGRGKYKSRYLHREIMNPPPGHEVIFLNGDKLDCRRENLRVVTKKEARQHHGVRSDSESGIKGIKYNWRPKTWSVNIYRGDRMNRIGTFLTQSEAIEAYEKALRRENPDLHSVPETVERRNESVQQDQTAHV